MNTQEFHKGMKDFFEITQPGIFLDNIALVFRKVSIDIIKFDDWLHKKIGNYEDSGLNMKEALSLHYNKEASDFIENLLRTVDII